MEERLIPIIEATPDFVGMANAFGRVTYINRAGRRMIGIGENAPVEDTMISDYHPKDIAALVLNVAIPAAIQNGSWCGETRLRTVSGKEIPVSQVVLAHKGPNGDVDYLSTIIRNIADAKHVEAGQRFIIEVSRTLATVIDYEDTIQTLARLVVPRIADWCVIDLLDGGEIRRVAVAHKTRSKEERLKELLRCCPPNPERTAGVAKVIRERVSELVPEVSDAWLWAATEDEGHFNLIREFTPRSVIIVPMIARDHTVGAMMMATSDSESDRQYGPQDLALAERLANLAALGIDNARLFRESQQATEVRDEVLRIVAHDLRNPLNLIALSAKLLQKKTSQSEALAGEHRQLGIIVASVERADRLIQELLDVARIKTGHLNLQRQPEEVAPLVRDAVELHLPVAKQKNVRLLVELPAELPQIYADRDRMLRVFQNLIGNAIKFTPKEGQITVAAARRNSHIQFSISDTGIGIPKQDLPHLFDPFWQARPGSGEGAGLGLAIAYGIVQAHGGETSVTSEAGVGTTMSFTIPIAATDTDAD